MLHVLNGTPDLNWLKLILFLTGPINKSGLILRKMIFPIIFCMTADIRVSVAPHVPELLNPDKIYVQADGGGRIRNIRNADCISTKGIKMENIEKLEAQSVYILREAYKDFKSLCMLWSIGKDSTVLLWLARKAFLSPLLICNPHSLCSGSS